MQQKPNWNDQSQNPIFVEMNKNVQFIFLSPIKYIYNIGISCYK
jgi:hypothetical protein